MTEYVTCPFCKRERLEITTLVVSKHTTGFCHFCEMCFPSVKTREAMLAVIKGTHYDGPEVV